MVYNIYIIVRRRSIDLVEFINILFLIVVDLFARIITAFGARFGIVFLTAFQKWTFLAQTEYIF